MIKAIGFLASKRQNMLTRGVKLFIFDGSAVEPLPAFIAILLISGLGKSFNVAIIGRADGRALPHSISAESFCRCVVR